MTTPSTSRAHPRLVIVAGINGAGKSTLAKITNARALLDDVPAINPDDITRDMHEKYQVSGLAADLLAVNITELQAYQAVAEGASVALETVLSTTKYLRLIRAARHRGYRTALIYISLPSLDLAIARVALRVRAGGHHVPQDRIADRWPKTLDNFITFMQEVHDTVLISNAGDEPLIVGDRTDPNPFQLRDPAALPEITERLRKARLIP